MGSSTLIVALSLAISSPFRDPGVSMKDLCYGEICLVFIALRIALVVCVRLLIVQEK